jgi:hypothetical protein
MFSMFPAMVFRGIDDNGNITEAGHQASRLPVDPQIAKMLLEAPKHRCSTFEKTASRMELDGGEWNM